MDPTEIDEMNETHDMVYAEYWKRILATLLDGLFVALVACLIGSFVYTLAFGFNLVQVDPAHDDFAYKLGEGIGAVLCISVACWFENIFVGYANLLAIFSLVPTTSNLFVFATPVYLLVSLVNFLYHTLMDSSPRQGTIGKVIFNIKVVDTNGERISYLRAVGRHMIKCVTSLLILASLITMAVTQKKQALHELLTGTTVVKKH